MKYENLILDIKQRIAIVRINRPESLNALNTPTLLELHSVFSELKADNNIRAIILTGSGEKSFVAGADIKEFTDIDVNAARELSQTGQNQVFNFIENLNKPVIAAINGFALGGGLELAMSCHIRYASDNAKLGLPEVTLGLIPGYGGTQRLPRLVGKGIANEMIFSARMISAERAKETGLVNDVFSQEELLVKAEELANQIAKNSPMAIEKAIIAVNLSDGENGFETEIENFAELFGLSDKQEGVNAFIEKRKPQF